MIKAVKMKMTSRNDVFLKRTGLKAHAGNGTGVEVRAFKVRITDGFVWFRHEQQLKEYKL